MVVGGPNARTDYHINSTPEFFYQHKGSMLLKTVDTSTNPHSFVDIPIHENSLYLLPANTPHNPVRLCGVFAGNKYREFSWMGMSTKEWGLVEVSTVLRSMEPLC